MANYSRIGFFAAWNLECYEGEYYAPNMHSAYIEYMSKHYDSVTLVSSTVNISKIPTGTCLTQFANLYVVPLPHAATYASTILQARKYHKVLKSIKQDVDVLYVRTPDPFSWMPRFLGFNTIMDFVGDTIHCTWHNENWSIWKKLLMIGGYLPDYIMTLVSASRSKTFTAGGLLSERLARFGVKATPLIPSVFGRDSIPLKLHSLQTNPVRIVYIGYLRYAKGINCLMETCKMLESKSINYVFDIIGDGEMREELNKFRDKGYPIILHGHIDDRDRINSILSNSDIFFFPSLSEGAPRVVIEAMAQGVPVVSTPVGSLPYTFVDGEDIRFFEFNDAAAAVSIIEDYIKDCDRFDIMRRKAHKRTRENFTIEAFFSKLLERE